MAKGKKLTQHDAAKKLATEQMSDVVEMKTVKKTDAESIEDKS